MIIFIVPKNSGLQDCKRILEEKKIKGKVIEVRGEDVPLVVSKFIKEGSEAIGITGEDLLKEFMLKTRDSGIEILERRPWFDESCIFKKPTLCLLGPKDKRIEDMPKRLKICINSKYKELAKKGCTNILENNGYTFEKMYASGATEEFFSNKLVDLVIDIVCSGKSAEEAGLEVYDKIFSSDIVILGKEKNSNLVCELDFEKGNGLIPTILKDENGKVLTLVYSNKESLVKTLEEKKPYFFSRARNRVCLKGETSGNTQELVEIKKDCDSDALLFIIKQKGNACSHNTYSCFGEEYEFTLEELYKKLMKRINSTDENSYTKKLVNDPELLKRKLIEEAAEVITSKNKEELIWEASDLLYFLLVILAKEGVTLKDINKENERRNKK